MDTALLDRLKQEPTCDVEDAAAVLGISRGSAYQGVKSGDIPSIRIGHRLRVPTRALLAMIGIETGS